MTVSTVSAPDDTRMKPAVKAEWLRALRSGEYKQTSSYLHIVEDGQDKFCCLGVLCEVSRKMGLDLDIYVPEPDENGQFEVGYGEFESQELLPPEVREFAGMDSEAGTFMSGLFTDTLADLNDRGRSFEEIAAVIETEF